MKIKLFENFTNKIISQGKLDISNLYRVSNISDLNDSNYGVDRLNKYLLKYYIRNKKKTGYYDIFITDNQQNILFGESIEQNKFNYELTFKRNHISFIYKNNITSKFGLVDESGKNILVKDDYDNITLSDDIWILSTGSYAKADKIKIVDLKGVTLLEETTLFDNIIKTDEFIKGNWISVIKYRIKGQINNNILPADEFFSTNWELKLTTQKYNL